MTDLEVEDTLNPQTEWVDDSCYRVNRKRTSSTKKKVHQNPGQHQPYTDNEEVIQCDELADYDVDVTENGRFKTRIRLPQTFFAYIIGTKGSRRKKLEDETKTDILIPRGSTNNNISITGASERSVILARQRLEMIASDLRRRHQITHFISFPLTDPEIKTNFTKFKGLVLKEGHIDGLDETIFQKVDKLHITVGVMVLLDEYEKDEAANILDQLKKDLIKPQLKDSSPLIIKMKGLEYMNDDPSQVDVLYAKVYVTNHEDENILQKLSDGIVDFFAKKGSLKKEGDHVKLHATLINTRYRKDSENSLSSWNMDRKAKRISFDARPILAKYADFDFGEHKFDSIHISHCFSSDNNGYYESIHTISCV